MKNDSAVLILATFIGIMSTYVVFWFEYAFLPDLFSDVVNVAIALFLGAVSHGLCRHFLLKEKK